MKHRAIQGLVGVACAAVGASLSLALDPAWGGVAVFGLLLYLEAAWGRWGD